VSSHLVSPGDVPEPVRRLVIVPARLPVPGVAAPSVPDDPAAFTAAVEALSSAFGDPTRRAIFLYVRANPGSTASDVARAHSVHPNVARHHLDRLVAAGHVSSSTTRGSVGRPAKSYEATTAPLTTGTETRLDELLVALLERSLELLGPERAEAMALEVGQAHGMRLAKEHGTADSHRSAKGAMAQVASALTAHGFAARAEIHAGAPSVVAETCPFGEAAAHHPVLCAVDRGLVVGMLEGMGAATPVQMSSRARGDDACRASA
jgi:predicted ArsR family transcriptional regulator